MEFTGIPIVVVCCYLIGEIYKFIFKNKQQTYKLIPIILATFGGGIAIAIYYTNPEMIFEVENVWIALGIGIVSGSSATGTNQIIKQLFGKNNNKAEKGEKNE